MADVRKNEDQADVRKNEDQWKKRLRNFFKNFFVGNFEIGPELLEFLKSDDK